MRLKYTYFLFLALLTWVVLRSDSSGRGSNTTTCGSGGCHSSQAAGTTTVDSIALYDLTTSSFVSQWTAGHNYRVLFVGHYLGATILPKYGFQLNNGGKGTFSSPPTGTNLSTSGGITYWGHTTRLDTALTIGSSPIFASVYMDSINWTPPSAGAGTVTFGCIINAVNFNSNNSGDKPSSLTTQQFSELSSNANVTIAMLPSNTSFCAGVTKTFTATPTNGGTAPTYQWYLNGTTVGTGGTTYTTSTLADNDSVWVVMTSSQSGIGNNPATSNKIKVTVNPTFNNSVTIVADKSSMCAGDTITFTATPASGSTGVRYNWYRNQTQVAGPLFSPTYKQIGAAAGDSFSCRIQVFNQCPTPTIAVSNYIKPTVMTSPIITGLVNDTFCEGDSSLATNWQSTIGGTTYTWKNSNTGIGLVSSGSGQIPKFKAPDNIPFPSISATITVYSFGGGCSGAPVTYNVFVKRRPRFNIANLKKFYCPGESGSITVSANPSPGTVINWTNDNTNTGLAASGNNGFINFTAMNNSNDTIVSNITASLSINGGCRRDTTFKVVVYPAPTVNFVNDTEVCAGDVLPEYMFNSPTSGVSFSWTNNETGIGLAASGTGNISSFTTTNSTSGALNANIQVNAQYATCVGPPFNFKIAVNNKSAPSIIIDTKDTGICPGESAFFRSAVTNGGTMPSYQWYRNGVMISGASKDTVTIFNATRTDTIECIVTSNSLCVTTPTGNSNKYVIKTVDKIVPTISITSLKDTLCVGEVLVFNTTITGGGATPSYQWTKNGNAISGANSDIYFASDFQMNDTIRCILTSGFSCADPQTVSSNFIKLNVFNYTPTTISLSKDKNNICSDEYVTFTTTFTGGGLNPKVNWKLNGDQMNTNKKFITVPINSQYDVVELTVTSGEPCPQPPFPTLYISVDTVKQGPVVNVIPNKFQAICDGDSTLVKAYNGQSNYQYQWSNGVMTDSFWSKTNTSYMLTVTETGNVCPRFYGPLTTSIQPLPAKPEITRNGNVLTSSLSTAYQWQLNKLDIVGADKQTYDLIISGVYRVKVTNNANCSNYSDEISAAPSSINTGLKEHSISIFPNPSTGNINIVSYEEKIVELTIYDLTGKSVFSDSKIELKKQIQLDNLPKGNYSILLKTNRDSYIHKIELR